MATQRIIILTAALAATTLAQQSAPPKQANPPIAAPAKDSAVDVEAARAALAKWTESQQLIVKEKKEWAQAEEMLKYRIEALKKEIETLDKKRAEYEANITKADQEKERLIKDRDAATSQMSALSGTIADLETRVRALVPRLPEPLQRKLQPLVEKIPTDPKTTKVILPARFGFVLAVLQEINKANGEIIVELEMRTLEDGRVNEVQTIYIGLAQAFYVTANRKFAGIGTPTDNGWKWQPANQLASRLSDAIDIFKAKGHAHFIPLPIRIQ